MNAWVEAEWLLPLTRGKTLQFSDADLARVRLIRDLQVDFGLNAEGIAIVLNLLDQLHGLRSPLRDICAMQVANCASDIG